MSMESMEIIEVTVKCRVPANEAEDHIIRLRSGEERLPVPLGLVCRDAFDCHETTDPAAIVIRAGYR
jgi:hypothetical protein